MATYGPKTSLITVPNPFNPNYRVYYGRRQGYVQKPRTDTPTYVDIQRYACARPDLWNAYCDAPNSNVAYRCLSPGFETPGSAGSWGRRQQTEALNKCYYKFKEQVYTSSASFGANLAEYKQTVDMIANDCMTLRKAWNHLRRGQFRKFKEDLGLTHRKGESPWSKPEIAGSLWLQYHFGWDPLVKDIHEGIQVLENEFPTKKIRVRASKSGSYSLTNNYGGWNYVVPKFTYRYMMGATVRCLNPNLHRATALGLTNPATIAWEIVPFSFVVDWFWPIGQFLDSWTDFIGLEFRDAFTTRSAFATGDQYERNPLWYDGGQISANRWYGMKARCVRRELTILGPSFPYPKQFKGFSVVRGATAVALLVGTLSNERRYFAQTAHGS